jgi:G:T-mismatch repair DNA endonuclease (very short patch repair protein)
VDKITSNSERDKASLQKLTALGWNIITVWECEIRHTHKHDISGHRKNNLFFRKTVLFQRFKVLFAAPRQTVILRFLS